MKKLILFFGIIFLAYLSSAQVVSSDENFFGSRTGTASYVSYGSSFSSYYGSQASTYWPILSNRDECTASQDILVQVTPAGCQPAVVRSDLIAEQNVPIFCQLDLLQVNPAIDIKQIRNIRFSGNYPEYVAGVGFHPANAALRTTNKLLGTPLESNIGYVVIVLKRNPDESTLPDFFNFTLSASIDYYSGNAVGIGATELLLKESNDDNWKVDKNKQTLFGGKMSVRVKEIDSNDSINVELYSGDVKYSEITLQKRGTQATPIYLPGSYCQTQLQFSYDDFVSPSVIARIQVDDDLLDLYEGSRFLNNKCSVRNVNSGNSNGTVDVNCGGKNIRLSNNIQIFNVGERVYKVDNTFNVNRTQEYSIRNTITNSSGNYYEISKTGSNDIEHVPSSRVRPISNIELFDADYGQYDSYITDSISQYEFLADSYGNEKKDLGEYYGDVALSEAIRLSIEYNKKVTAVRLINKYLGLYPNGQNSIEFTRSLNDLYVTDSSSVQTIETDDGIHTIKLIGVFGSDKKSSAKISWGNEQQTIEQGTTLNFTSGKLTLINVRDSETVEIDASCNSIQNNRDYRGLINIRDNSLTACGSILRVSNIDLQNYVKLRISPVTRSGTFTNFTVGVGIEKRAIELTPAKASKKIENLNKSIERWESISKSLGDLVTGLKGACFATAGILTVKNFFTGLSGEALARRSVMTGEDGWTKFCQNEVNAGRQSSLTACYNANSGDIAKDVNARKQAIEQTNTLTEQIESSTKVENTEGLFTGASFNDEAAKGQLIEKIKSECGNQNLGSKSTSNGLNYGNVGSLFPANYDVKSYSYTQLRDIYFNCKSLGNGGSSKGDLRARTELDSIGANIGENLKRQTDLNSLQSASIGTGLANIPVDVQGDAKSITGKYYGGKLINGNFGLDSSYDGKPAQVEYYNGKPYLFVLKQEAGGTIVPEKVFALNQQGNGFVVASGASAPDTSDVLSKFSKFETRDSKSYNNQFAPGENVVRYFETEPYKGMPAVVPFDLNRGFYAATTQSLPLFGGTKSYEENGRPSSFFVCNVMSDKKVGFYAPNYGDDECVQFNLYTGQPFTQFPGLSESDTKKVVSDAIKALEEAAQQYGKNTLKIRGNNLNVGNPASLLPGSQCQDYMSPEECRLLFNVCDPVICPTSRCNFGGEYYVSDVIQSGIVGSALLCLPNVKDGIVIPVCLTGVKAGIDGYLSILKSHQQCLQEAIDTGQYVGICDQVSSVYLCEFFWRQAAPLAKTVIPKVVEYAYNGGQNNVRGGGEYLTVQSSWENAQDSVNYFTQSYAVNSFEAFRVRSVEEAGTEICRAFISAKVPSSFETLIEPDSPPQFHAWFSSIDYTDATIPATSQYKVFYHIFAGNDRGVSYSVYLKDPPASSQYSTNPVVVVQTGFVARGQYATESKDFTAPKGYKQLCVRINDKEECGFKEVSTSFAVNYITDSIVADELTRTDITTETECVSGSVSPAALLNPNLQSATEEALNPAIYNRGIVRVCATDNPGSATDPTRFVKVGICGSERLGCWLDKNSLENVVSDVNVGLQNKTLSQIEQIQKDNFADDGRFIGTPELKTELDRITKDIDKVNSNNLQTVLNNLDALMLRTFWNSDKAEIIFWKAIAYKNTFVNSLPKTEISGTVPRSNDYAPVNNYSDFALDAVYLHQASGKYYQVVSINSQEVTLTHLLKWGVYDQEDVLKISKNSGSSVFNSLLRYNGNGDIFDSGSTQQTGAASENGPRVLGFAQEYRPSIRNVIQLNGKNTSLLVFNDEVIFEGNGIVKVSYKVGSVRGGKLIIDNSNYEQKINDIFGAGSYQIFNNGVAIDNIINSVDLENLDTITGSINQIR